MSFPGDQADRDRVAVWLDAQPKIDALACMAALIAEEGDPPSVAYVVRVEAEGDVHVIVPDVDVDARIALSNWLDQQPAQKALFDYAVSLEPTELPAALDELVRLD